MSDVQVRIPAPLRQFTGGAATIAARGQTVRDVLEGIEAEHGGLLERIVDERGAVRNFVSIFVDDTNIRALEGLDSPVGADSVISIIPAVAGGLDNSRHVSIPGGRRPRITA